VLLRSDVTRKKLCGVAPTERLGADAYAEQVSARVYDSLAARAAAILAAGHAAIVDAVFLDPQERARIERVATERGVRFDGIWLAADPAVLAQRVALRRGDASDATAAVVRRQIALDPGAIEWHRVDSSGAPEQVAAAAGAALGP
jgi:hypothetical protein